MERMTKIGLLNFIDEHNFNDGVEWNINFVSAHACINKIDN